MARFEFAINAKWRVPRARQTCRWRSSLVRRLRGRGEMWPWQSPSGCTSMFYPTNDMGEIKLRCPSIFCPRLLRRFRRPRVPGRQPQVPRGRNGRPESREGHAETRPASKSHSKTREPPHHRKQDHWGRPSRSVRRFPRSLATVESFSPVVECIADCA